MEFLPTGRERVLDRLAALVKNARMLRQPEPPRRNPLRSGLRTSSLISVASDDQGDAWLDPHRQAAHQTHDL